MDQHQTAMRAVPRCPLPPPDSYITEGSGSHWFYKTKSSLQSLQSVIRLDVNQRKAEQDQPRLAGSARDHSSPR